MAPVHQDPPLYLVTGSMQMLDTAPHPAGGAVPVVVASILRRAVAAASISGGLPGPRPTAVVRHGKPGGSARRCVGRSMPLTLRCRRNRCLAAKTEAACHKQTNIRTMRISSRISVRISINAVAWGLPVAVLAGGLPGRALETLLARLQVLAERRGLRAPNVQRFQMGHCSACG